MNDIAKWLQNNDVRMVECLFPDLTGTACGKVMPLASFLALKELRFPQVSLLQSITGECLQQLVPEVDPDMVLMPDHATLRLAPWSQQHTALLIHDCVYPEGQPVAFSPRNVLKRVLDRYHAQGLTPIIAPEMEFYLFPEGQFGQSQQHEPRHPYSLERIQRWEQVVQDIRDACVTLGIAADALLQEVGHGQIEFNLQHGEALGLADQVFLFKRAVRHIAKQHGLEACFMAKPLANEAGSAMHIHQSLVHADGSNAFSLESGQPAARFPHFIAGLQHYLPVCMPLWAPYINSFRRLAPHTAAPTNIEWGYDNRTCGLRVPPSVPQARRVENRLPGADCNPYLAIAASLGCGLLGIEYELKPSAALENSAYHKPYSLPLSPMAAIKQLENAEALAELFGEAFIQPYCQLKRYEQQKFEQVVTDWECHYLFGQV